MVVCILQVRCGGSSLSLLLLGCEALFHDPFKGCSLCSVDCGRRWCAAGDGDDEKVDECGTETGTGTVGWWPGLSLVRNKRWCGLDVGVADH